MIRATILHNRAGEAVGFAVKNHGDPVVCAAVSMLTLNTVNSIEKLTALTRQDFNCFWNDDGGFIVFALKRSSLRSTGAGLLLDALVLGLYDVSTQYPNDIQFDSRSISG
ncbi:MAG: ribosomal-processing cysteine protease Prp [Defluviitaleaceae bacterium]|nr:ribosomal-processing cysteine protease Prp [Defluviitaleaceae bacterium]